MSAKYVVCSISTQEAILLRSFFNDLNLTSRVDDPIKMSCDNTASIQFAKDLKFHWNTKHIERHYYFVRDIIKTKEIAIKCISINKMIVDPLIKPIPRDAFKYHGLGLRRI